MESASVMMGRIEPILDRDFPVLPADIRHEVVSTLPYHAALVEAPFMVPGVMHLLTPEMRLETWTTVMRGMVKQLLERAQVAN